MCKKLICLTSFLVMLALAGNASADLLAHWRLEEGSGTTTIAAVGSPEADGMLVGATWITSGLAPIDGTGAAVFFTSADSDRIETNHPGVVGQAARTVTAWIRAEPTQNNNAVMVGWGANNATERYSFRLNGSASNGPLWALRLEIQGSRSVTTTPVNDGQWHHVVVTHGEGATIDDVRFYLDGQVDEVTGTAGGGLINTASTSVVLGNSGHSVDGYGFDGAMDDVRIYDHVLSLQEIRRLASRPRAFGSDPTDGTMLEDTWVSLSWMPGDLTVSHDVYLGENFDDVNNATRESDVFRGNQALTFYMAGISGYAYPEGLVTGTTYYWRIDEVNDAEPNSPWKSDVWSFWIPPVQAYDSDPADGIEYVDPNVNLSWTAGLNAKLHTAYFGDNFDDVNNAAGGMPLVDITYNPGQLEREKVYYWRVDEFDGAATQKGDIWSFTTIPIIPMTDDPSLVAWWTLDEGTGITAVDWSGYDHHGAIRGSTFWAEGYDLGALEFTGPGDFVEMNGYEGITGTNSRTTTAWVRTTTPNRTILSWGLNVAGQKWRVRSDATGGLRVEVNGGYHYGVTNIADGQWHHVAVTFEDDGTPDALDTVLYVDGQLDATADSLDEPIDTSASGVVRIGESPWHNAPFVGLIDDVRIYDKVLTQQEIQLVMRIDPLLAWQPSPANGSTSDIDNVMPLSWIRGDKVSQHDVYFGTDKDAVNNADASDTTGIYRARQAGTSYTLPEGVEWGGGPYYWRIDENNTDGTVTKGRVWSFMVADSILVEDFETYDANDNQIWCAWHDGLGYGSPDVPPYFVGNGTGSAVGDETTASYTEETIVNGGHQSMPLAYDNNKQGFAKYSETELTLTATRDWTKHELAELSIWFRGNPASTGSFVEAPLGTYTMTGSGTDIWSAADEFHFAYKVLTGPGSVIARVESVEQTNNWAKAGVMIRETLDAGSKFAAVYITPTNADDTATNGCRFQARTDTDIDATSDTSVVTTEQTAITAPYWVKIERDIAGNFRGYYSANGTTWQSMSWNPQNIMMGSNVYVGLALTSHNPAATCEAKFSNVTIAGPVGPQWANQDIGISSNAAEPLYVALSDSAGAPAVAYHDDPAAATIDTWTEWVIPLQAFADQGISLTNVDRIAIGLGTRGNMTNPGGSGKMYIDDIRLYRSRVAAGE